LSWQQTLSISSSELFARNDGIRLEAARTSCNGQGSCSNRKATIVVEHLIQASDVAHTMQHWHVFVQWNERLFQEMYKAYLNGRADKDPSDNWFASEIGFFDFYVIRLPKS
jgi:hypothetical protein